MPIPPILKELLVCPRCRGELTFHEEKGRVDCPACALSFAIHDGVPNMLLDEATPFGEAPK